MYMRTILLTLLCFSQSGCFPLDPKKSRAAAVYVNELRAHGGTYLAGHSNPNSLTPTCSEDGLYIGNLGGNDFYFSPPMNYADIEQYSGLVSAQNEGIDITNENFWEPYTFVFSTEQDDGFSGIEGSMLSIPNFFQQFEEDEIPNIYTQSVGLGIMGSRPEFILFGTYYLYAFPGSVPVNSTHVELWFSTSRDDEPELIHRIPLQYFLSWRTLVQPYIDTSSGTGIAVCNPNAF